MHDISKILELAPDYFEKVKGDADTLGGLLMEIQEKIPSKGEKIIFDNITFTVESADSRRIKRVKLSIARTQREADENE